MKTCLIPLFSLIFFAEQTSAQTFSLQDFAPLYGLQGAWSLSAKRGGMLHEVWQIQNMQYLQSRSFIVRDKDTIPQESVQLRYQDGRITYASTVPNQNAGEPVTFTLVSHTGGEYIFENKAHDFPQRIVYRVPADSTLDVYIEGPSSGSVKKIPYPFKRITPAPLKLEKRLLGTWSAKGQAFGMPADVTMKWEPDMQNKFFLLSYRMDMRDTAGRVQTFEGKAYYKASKEAGKFTATWFDSGGEVHPIEAGYDGESLTALWGTPATKMGKTVYRFVDDNTIEITDFIQRKDGEWRQFNRNTVRRM